MRRAFVVLTAILALAPASVLLAQDKPSPAKRRTVDELVQDLKQKLNLTEDQVAKVSAVLKESSEQAQADRSPGEDREAAAKKRAERHQKVSEKIRALLNDEQKAKYEALEAEHRTPKPKQ